MPENKKNAEKVLKQIRERDFSRDYDCTPFECGVFSLLDEAASVIEISLMENQRLIDLGKKYKNGAEKAEKQRDSICAYIDSEGLLRKYFCENGNADFEPFVCPSLKEHSGYIDSDDCEGCKHFCNSFFDKKEE